MFALIDVNGMYASCEQAFRPDLANRAVAVLSNNDGNIVARNYPVSYTHLTLPTTIGWCRSRWSPYH